MKEYYLGLDMGTSSVGWAVTDNQYKLMRAKGKDLWGVRLFREANTSEQRRSFRIARRRLQREKARIGYLKQLFADEIEKVDAGFYQRLDDSKYYVEDKVEQQPFALFADTNYTDRDYYKEYPTIFHLRKKLMSTNEPQDVRLVYLAILNMFKHRGHFLNSNLDEEGNGNLLEQLSALSNLLEEYGDCESDYNFDILKMQNSLENILPSKNFSSSKKVELILQENNLKKNKDRALTEMIKMFCGLQGKLSVLFVNDLFEDDNKKFSLSFKDANFEEKQTQASEILKEESFEILMLLKQIHDWGVLANILHGSTSLSEARVKSYEKHQYDLKILKKLYKKHLSEHYDDMFRKMDANNYSSYVGSVNSGKEVLRRGAKCNRIDFFAKIKKMVNTIPDCEEKNYVIDEIDKETFLPKQLTSSNGVIPNQVHKKELKAILKNAECYLPFLKEKDATEITVSEKIIKLFEFQIPYYIGPLVKSQNGNAWVVRKKNGKVLPWNLEEMVDMKATAEKFIENMVRKCSYLNDEHVLPKNSLLYEKFMVLNELNNLKVNGTLISAELKQDLYIDLFRKGKKVTRKELINKLKEYGVVGAKENPEINGIDGDFKNTLSNYAKFSAIFETDCLNYEQEQIAEKIVFWSTVYGDSRKFLKEKIEENYATVLNAKQIKRILGFKFKDWGKLSREFLYMNGMEYATGENESIISKMWNDNYNLMELLSSKFTYLDELKERTNKCEKILNEFTFEDLEELYISAPVRRMIWQTILILKELYQVLGTEPKKIFVEMARDVDTKKERKDSRKQKFAELYKNCKDDGIRWSEQIKETAESSFRSKKLYLYYTQKGRCMYTGERIELEDLVHNDRYDIDHIYPRHFVKDDSIENNLVLVKKEKNAHKSDIFPIEQSIRESQFLRWKMLRDGGFITEEKYKRLTRREDFTDEERAAFINRQIVEVRQGTKVITDLLEQTFGEQTEIIYVKAGNVSDFRKKYNIIKCRDVNDLHHAHDAYLNVVVGNTYHVKFTKNPLNFVKQYRRNPEKHKYHMYRLFDFDVIRNGETAWEATDNKSIRTVKCMINKQTPLLTRMSFEENGALADQTIYCADEAEKVNAIGYLPIKSSEERLHQICKYGGYKKYTGTYFFLVEHEVKGKKIRTIEALPLYLKKELDSNEKIEYYCREKLGYVNPSVRVSKIKMYSLIQVDGYNLYLTGRTGNQLLVSNAVPLILSYEEMLYIKKIKAYSMESKLDSEWLEKNQITQKKNLDIYDLLSQKHSNAIFKKRPNGVGEKLVLSRSKFEKLDIKDQVYIIVQILQLTMLSNMGADLVNIGESKKTGVMTLNKKISDKKEFKVIHQSPSGLFVQIIDLLTV